MNLGNELKIFKKNHLIKGKDVSGIRWEYIVAGKGKETILMIHGGVGSAESLFRYTTALENDYRIITPTIPTEITTVKEVLAGVEDILNTEGASEVNLIGFSLGGMVEQIFLREHPENIKALVLFHVPPPSKLYAKKIERIVKTNQNLPQWLPGILSSLYMKITFPREYPKVSKNDRNFWIDFYTRNTSKVRLVNQMTIVLDYLLNYDFKPDDLSSWRGKVLIFETTTDTMIPENEREQLKKIYPQAKVHTFSEGSHLGNGLFQVETTISLIRAFLAEGK